MYNPYKASPLNQKMNKETDRKTVNIRRWLEKSLSLESVTIEAVEDALVKILESKKFKIRSHSSSNGSSTIEAIYGTKLRAFSVAQIPFIGVHLSAGKRFLIKARLRTGELVSIDINITPYMELFNSEEIGAVTQSIFEKASDEYVAAKMLFFIIRDLYSYLGLPRPKDLSEFDAKSFANDTMWGILIFYMDSYSSTKVIYTSPSSKSPWSWSAFIIPEFWFLWHEMLGAHAFFSLPLALYFIVDNFGWPNLYVKYSVIVMIVLFHILAGAKGNRIFYARYGYFPHEKQYAVPDKGPKWNWGAFIIPELWFMAHEIIGISFIAIALDAVLFFFNDYIFFNYYTFFNDYTYFDNFQLSLVFIFFFIRIFFGLRGNKLYYAKYGKWPK